MNDPELCSDLDADLSRIHIADREISEAIATGRREQAQGLAVRRAVEALCDLAVLKLAEGDLDQAVKQMESVINFHCLSQHAFHNYVAILLAHGQLRGAILDTLQRLLVQHWHAQPWMHRYRKVLLAPRFLNLEFVSGKCNLKCRMCVAGHGKTEPGRLSYMTCEDFGGMLAAVPTVGGLTLSSGDSEPLLHPEFEQIVDLVTQHHVATDIFTNGHPLNARKARKIVQSGVIGMVNFSLDAATPETYRRIRGEDFHRVIQKIEMLRSMKEESKVQRPQISLSFVAMADNIAELPAFVELAHRLGAMRVYVEDLIGWDEADSVNRPATDHPQCRELLTDAMERAASLHIRLDAPERLLREPTANSGNGSESSLSASAESPAGAERAAPSAPRLRRCGWLHGLWVQQNGRFDPCCLIHDVVDMGGLQNGPVFGNHKLTRVKELLLDGQVFPECINQRACVFVQQQNGDGIPLRIIKPEDLADSSSEHHQVCKRASAGLSDEAAEVLLAIAGNVPGHSRPLRLSCKLPSNQPCPPAPCPETVLG